METGLLQHLRSPSQIYVQSGLIEGSKYNAWKRGKKAIEKKSCSSFFPLILIIKNHGNCSINMRELKIIARVLVTRETEVKFGDEIYHLLTSICTPAVL